MNKSSLDHQFMNYMDYMKHYYYKDFNFNKLDSQDDEK